MKKNISFTLIEMLIVVGTTSLIIPTLFSIIYNIAQQQTKIYRLTEVKRQGDYILNTIENTIKNHAVSIHALTPTPPTSDSKICQGTSEQNFDGYFLDKFDSYFRFCQSSNGTSCDNGNDYVASFSSVPNFNTIPLNNNKIRVTNFLLTCSQTNPYSPPLVGIKFKISYKTDSPRPEDRAEISYQTKIKLRNY